MGEGREREPSSLAPTLPLALTYTPLGPSLSICPLPSSSAGCQSHFPPTPHVCLSFSGQGSRPPCFGTQAAPSCVWKQGVLGKLGPGFPGAWRGAGQALEGCQPVGCESELSTAPAPPSCHRRGLHCPGACSALALRGTHLSAVTLPAPRVPPAPSSPLGPQWPPSGLSRGPPLCYLSVLL